MSQKLSTVLLVCICLLGVNQVLWGQNAASANRIPGYLDAKTREFHTLPVPNAAGPALPPAVFAGKFVTNFNITVAASIPATAKISCTVEASVTEIDLTTQSANVFFETASVLAVRNGTTATCAVNIPYSWNLTTPALDRVQLQYSIVAPVETTVVTAILPARTSSHTFANLAVPANGITTTTTVAARF